MAYRDDSQPLRERHESLSLALEQVRAHARALACEEAALAGELERVSAQLLDGVVPKRRARSFVVAMVAAGGSALLAFAAFARIMTSEIAPFEMRAQAPRSPAQVLAAPVDIDDDDNLGYLRVEAPRGSQIFEGDELLGTAPLIRPLPSGSHAIRVVPEGGPARTKLGFVRNRSISTLRFD